MRFFSIFLLFVCTGCGFLDDDFLLDDEEYEKKIDSESFDFDAMSIYGSGGGSYGYGGSSGYHYGRRTRKNVVRSSVNIAGKESTNESSGAKENKIAADSRSSFVRLIDNYGAQKHSLNARLP